MNDENEKPEPSFAIFAECQDFERALIMTGLSFGRLIDDIVKPLEEGEPLFIDGVPVTKDKVRRIKILRESKNLKHNLADLHWRLRRPPASETKVLADQYHIRVEAILREASEDVTAQVLKAFDAKIKPKLKDYLPKRQELLEAALKVFIEGVKALGKA